MSNKNWSFFTIEKICNDKGQIYLKRYRLIETPYFKVYLHRILLSDSDRAMHCHPWDFTSIILYNGYIEHTPDNINVCKMGDIIRHKAEDLHRLELLPGQTCTSLVITGKKRRTWGFQTISKWIPFYEYKDAGRRC